MEYSQQLSERALSCLAILQQPSKKDIWKHRTDWYVNDVGTPFERVVSELGISKNAFRKLLRAELYGIAGVFFKTIPANPVISRLQEEITDEKYHEFTEQGFRLRYGSSGSAYLSISKNINVQQALYIPESLTANLEESIDHEDRKFVKEISPDSIGVLKFVYRRSLELRDKHGTNWYPIFSDKSISRDTGMKQEEVANSTKDLVGIICESYKMKSCKAWQKRYFLPSSKFPFVEKFAY